MTDWLPFVVSGLVVGSIFAIAAMGLVVTYRTTGLFNFAHGATGMAVAYGFYVLREDVGMPTLLAIALAPRRARARARHRHRAHSCSAARPGRPGHEGRR